MVKYQVVCKFFSQIQSSLSYSFLGTLNVSSLIVLAPSKNSIKTHLLISISLEMMMSHPLFLVVRFVLLWCCCWWYLQCFQLCLTLNFLISKEPKLFLKIPGFNWLTILQLMVELVTLDTIGDDEPFERLINIVLFGTFLFKIKDCWDTYYY